MAWLGNSAESMKIPTEKEGFRGILSFPRKLSLVKTENGYRLKQAFAVDSFEGCEGVDHSRVVSKETLTDHCVSETITDDGLTVFTNYINPDKNARFLKLI